jgi:hypothetical protein
MGSLGNCQEQPCKSKRRINASAFDELLLTYFGLFTIVKSNYLAFILFSTESIIRPFFNLRQRPAVL